MAYLTMSTVPKTIGGWIIVSLPHSLAGGRHLQCCWSSDARRPAYNGTTFLFSFYKPSFLSNISPRSSSASTTPSPISSSLANVSITPALNSAIEAPDVAPSPPPSLLYPPTTNLNSPSTAPTFPLRPLSLTPQNPIPKMAPQPVLSILSSSTLPLYLQSLLLV